jgi:hypothetical protein
MFNFFRDEDREKHRLEKLKVYQETGVMPGKKPYVVSVLSS